MTGTSANLGITADLNGYAIGATINYMASLSLALPRGVSFTSASGVFDTGVPEPASGMLLLPPVAGGLLARRRKSA